MQIVLKMSASRPGASQRFVSWNRVRASARIAEAGTERSDVGRPGAQGVWGRLSPQYGTKLLAAECVKYQRIRP